MIDILQPVRRAGTINDNTEAMVNGHGSTACLLYAWIVAYLFGVLLTPFENLSAESAATLQLWQVCLLAWFFHCARMLAYLFQIPLTAFGFFHMRKQPPAAKGSSDSISVLHPGADRPVLCVAFSPILNGRGHRDALTISPRRSF